MPTQREIMLRAVTLVCKDIDLKSLDCVDENYDLVGPITTTYINYKGFTLKLERIIFLNKDFLCLSYEGEIIRLKKIKMNNALWHRARIWGKTGSLYMADRFNRDLRDRIYGTKRIKITD